MSRIVKIRCIDNQICNYNLNDILKMDEFYIKNMLEDTDNDEELIEFNLNEDYDIIKNILDSLRYRSLIFNNDTNLLLMFQLCDKWCVPFWLLNKLQDKINGNDKLNKILHFINNIREETKYCKICHNGFKESLNQKDSCKRHLTKSCIPGTNKYTCCNKEKHCEIGFHIGDEKSNISNLAIINAIKYLV